MLAFSVSALISVLAYIFFWLPSSSNHPSHTPETMASVVRKLKSVVIAAPSGKHTATVIFVHGLGDTGSGIAPIARMLGRDPGLAHVKWVLPDAPIRSITANMGIPMPGWFDIRSFGDFNAREDEEGFAESANQIDDIISDEVQAGIDPSRIVLTGFSQGGAMSLLTGLTKSRKLAGIAVLSGWLPLREKFKEMASQETLSTPIFWGFGDSDPLVVPQLGKISVDYLVNTLGVRRTTSDNDVNGLLVNVYPDLEHSIDQEELKDLAVWLKKVVPEASDE